MNSRKLLLSLLLAALPAAAGVAGLKRVKAPKTMTIIGFAEKSPANRKVLHVNTGLVVYEVKFGPVYRRNIVAFKRRRPHTQMKLTVRSDEIIDIVAAEYSDSQGGR